MKALLMLTDVPKLLRIWELHGDRCESDETRAKAVSNMHVDVDTVARGPL